MATPVAVPTGFISFLLRCPRCLKPTRLFSKAIGQPDFTRCDHCGNTSPTAAFSVIWLQHEPAGQVEQPTRPGLKT